MNRADELVPVLVMFAVLAVLVVFAVMWNRGLDRPERQALLESTVKHWASTAWRWFLAFVFGSLFAVVAVGLLGLVEFGFDYRTRPRREVWGRVLDRVVFVGCVLSLTFRAHETLKR